MIVQNSVPVTFYSDYQRLKQILINLLRNSVKFCSAGRISIQVRAVILIEKCRYKRKEKGTQSEEIVFKEISKPAV